MTDDEYEASLHEWQGVADDVGYSYDALELLYEALSYAPQYHGEEPGDFDGVGRHVSAAELCRAVLQYGRDSFGSGRDEALIQLGLGNSEAVGRLVWALVRIGRIEATVADSEAEFSGLFDLGTQ